MTAEQTCPYCATLNKVFGLVRQEQADKTLTVRCVKCGKTFEAKERGKQ